MDINIRQLSPSEEDEIYDKVAYLFSEMYQFMDIVGLTHKLIDDGEFLWINTIKRSLGKLNLVVVATHGEKLVGFAAGNIRLLPKYLGNKKVGYISHIFVTDAYKKQNIGKSLFKELERCFAQKSVQAIELEVLVENTSGISFWEKMGFKADNLRMIKENEKI